MPTIELTDGTTTYDLTDGAAVSVRANSLNLGNPAASLAASLDYLGDAYRLTDHRFQSRSIGMTLDIRGATRAAVYAHIRNIETDAGGGATVCDRPGRLSVEAEVQRRQRRGSGRVVQRP